MILEQSCTAGNNMYWINTRAAKVVQRNYFQPKDSNIVPEQTHRAGNTVYWINTRAIKVAERHYFQPKIIIFHCGKKPYHY